MEMIEFIIYFSLLIASIILELYFLINTVARSVGTKISKRERRFSEVHRSSFINGSNNLYINMYSFRLFIAIIAYKEYNITINIINFL